MMMDFEEFKQSVAENIKDYLPEKYADASVELKEVLKNNDTVLTGLLIRTEDQNIAPNIYLEGYFEQYEDGRDIFDIMQNIADVRERTEAAHDFDVSRITELDKVRDQIICKLVNAEMNADYLADKPHTMMQDLAVIYAIDLGGSSNGHMTTPITQNLMEQYGLTGKELHDIALDNLAKSKIEFKTMRDVLMEMMFPDGINENDPRSHMLPPEEGVPSMYILSNGDKLNGASAILDSTAMEAISEKLGGDFIVLPSSIHEVIILPITEDMNRQALESMVQEVNAGQVAPEDRLSDNVYAYDSREHELVLAATMEERRQQREEAQKEAGETGRSAVKEKAERTERSSERVSMKDLLSEKMVEVAKNESSREHPVPSRKRETALA